MHLKVFNVLDELQYFLVFVFQVDIELDYHVFETVLLVDELLSRGCACVIQTVYSQIKVSTASLTAGL